MTPLSIEIPVRFGDVDHAQIVYYPRFYHFFHIAFEELFAQGLGVPYARVMAGEHIGYPSVRTECDYLDYETEPVAGGFKVNVSLPGGRKQTVHIMTNNTNVNIRVLFIFDSSLQNN